MEYNYLIMRRLCYQGQGFIILLLLLRFRSEEPVQDIS